MSSDGRRRRAIANHTSNPGGQLTHKFTIYISEPTMRLSLIALNHVSDHCLAYFFVVD